MQFFILILLVSFFIFLFFLYFVSRDDFVLIRRDITSDNIFNVAFLLAAVAILSSRLFYAFSHPNQNFLNPLYFLLFPYFPGLSLVGGVLGGGIFLYVIARVKKMPTARILDLFTLSFLASMPLGVVGYYILAGYNFLSFNVIFTIVSYITLFSIFVFFLLPRFSKGRVEEGNMATLFLVAFSAVSLLDLVVEGKFSISGEVIILFVLLISAASFYIRKTKLISKLVKRKK
ncbi:MAG: prolipoprotein diacylglyceryl transferase family protein [Candidatus Levyibacteriota bacterium]